MASKPTEDWVTLHLEWLGCEWMIIALWKPSGSSLSASCNAHPEICLVSVDGGIFQKPQSLTWVKELSIYRNQTKQLPFF